MKIVEMLKTILAVGTSSREYVEEEIEDEL